MEIKLSVKLTAKEMFNFMMKHTYSSMSGYIGLILSGCAFVGFIMTLTNSEVNIAYKIVLLITALLFTVIQPLTLYRKSKRQVEQNENINKPMEYKFTDAMIQISQGEEHVEYEWTQVIKVNSSKLCIFLYVSKYRAFIIPRRVFEDDGMAKLRDMIRKNATSAKSIAFGRVY